MWQQTLRETRHFHLSFTPGFSKHRNATSNNKLNFPKPVKESSPSSARHGISQFLPFLSGARWVQSCEENVAGRLLLGLSGKRFAAQAGVTSLSTHSLLSWCLAGLRLPGRAEEEEKSSVWKCSGKPKWAVPIAAGELSVATAFQRHNGHFPRRPAAGSRQLRGAGRASL